MEASMIISHAEYRYSTNTTIRDDCFRLGNDLAYNQGALEERTLFRL